MKEVAWREIRTRSAPRRSASSPAFSLRPPSSARSWLPCGPTVASDLREVTIGSVEVDDATRAQILAFCRRQPGRDVQDYRSTPDQVDQALTDGDIDVALEPGPDAGLEQ